MELFQPLDNRKGLVALSSVHVLYLPTYLMEGKEETSICSTCTHVGVIRVRKQSRHTDKRGIVTIMHGR